MFIVKPKHFSLYLIALLSSLAAVFHAQIASDFAFVTGDRFDGIIETSILEHWYNVFRGLASWDTTNYFYPHIGTLAYNDGYMLFGLWHSIFRAFGVDPFLSAEMVNIVFRIIGFVATYALSRQILRLEFGWSLLTAILFTITSSTFQQSIHAQLLSVSLVPLIVWLSARAAIALTEDNRTALLIWGIAAALLYAAWLLTAFYMAWFFAFYTLLCLLSLALIGERDKYRQIFLIARRQALALVLIAVVLLVSAAPFLYLYLPRAAETGMHGFGGVSPYLAEPFGILNIGPSNFVFGDLIQWLNNASPASFPAGGERVVGMPPILLVCFVISSIWCWRHIPVLRAPIVAIVIFWALTIKIGSSSPWILIYHVIPGAKAIRVVVRSYIFLAGPVTLITIVGLAGMLKQHGRALPAGLAFLLVIEQLNTGSVAFLDRAEEIRRLAALPSPPAECQAFAAMVSREGNQKTASEIINLYSHNVDAMLVAEVMDLPTINGMSTFNPPDWDFNDSSHFDYQMRVEAYREKHDIQGLCGLDLAALEWDVTPKLKSPVPSTPLARNMGVGIGEEGSSALSTDWWNVESWGAWGRTRATLWIIPPDSDVAGGNDSFQLTVFARAFPRTPSLSQRVTVYVDGKLTTVWDVQAVESEFSTVVKRLNRRAIKVEFVAEKPTSLKALGVSADDRVLGLGLSKYRIDLHQPELMNHAQ